jgi:ferric-dicitrate binding protein FerR (iron transport regulator)
MARWREILAALLAVCLVASPVLSAPAEILGTIVVADGASNWGAGVTAGTTVFTGDRLATSDTGSLQVRTAGARLQLAKASMATIDLAQGTPSVTLLRGAAAFSTANAKAFAVNVASAVIRPKDDQPTIGEVAVLGEKELVVKCTKGALTITVGDDSRVIPEGSAYRVVLDPALATEQDQPPPQGAGTKGIGHPPLVAGRSRFVWYATAAVAILTIIAIHEALESPDRP